MRVEEAVEFAFKAGLDVRGREAREAAMVAMALHASRTADPGPFLARDPQLAERAAVALANEKRDDLALQVMLWERDGAERGGEADVPRALRAYDLAVQWGEGGGGTENLAWIRDVPRDFAHREVLAKRLLLRAEAIARHRVGLAAASMEAELAELPRIRSFPTVFRACVVARSAAVVNRALEGLGALDPVDDTPTGRRLFSWFRAVLPLVRLDFEGAPVRRAAEEFQAGLVGGPAPGVGFWGAHLAAALARGRDVVGANNVIEEAQRALDRADPSARDEGAALAYVRGWLDNPRDPMVTPQPDLLLLPADRRPSAVQMAYGAAEAARAARDPGPILHALQIFDPEDMGGILPERGSTPLVAELFRTAAYVTAEGGALETLGALGARLRRFRLPVAGDIYVRALLADAAARIAARSGNEEAWAQALQLSARGLDRFEKAKLRGRAACEFIAALQTSPLERSWLDPGFNAVPATGAG